MEKSDYSIYFERDSGRLFAFQKLADDHTAGELPQLAILKKWWNYMADLMETNPDRSPACQELEEMFHLD